MSSIPKLFLARFKKMRLMGWLNLTLGPLILGGLLLFLIWPETLARIRQK